MAAIRTITCPICGQRHLIGSPCPTIERAAGAHPSRAMRIVLSLLVIALTAAGLTAASFAAADQWGRGYGIAIVACVWIVMQLFRLGYDFDDGIDLMQLFLPAPFDWSVKIERIVHFWTSPRVWFRCAYLGTLIAVVIIVLRFAARD